MWFGHTSLGAESEGVSRPVRTKWEAVTRIKGGVSFEANSFRVSDRAPTVTRDRRYVLAGVVAALGLITGLIMLEVLGTVLFAVTVAYVLLPVQGWLTRRGVSEWTAGVIATLIGFVGVVAVFAPIVYTLYVRRDELIGVLEAIPAEMTVTVMDEEFTIEAVEVQMWAIAQVQDIAVSLATSAPELAVKFALFVLLLFALLLKADAAVQAAVAPVPHEYRDIIYALGLRTRETLYAIYVLQLATAAMTLVVGYPLFWSLGYDAPFTLSLIAAILQFVPIIGPSLLIAPLALYEIVIVGDIATGVLVGVLGIGLIAWGPDVTIRPRLARRSAGLPGSLYFIGFTGGLFTLGAIGIVVGPLIVAVFVEAVSLLADEINQGELEVIEAEFDQVEEEWEAEVDGDGPSADAGEGASDLADGPAPEAE